MGCPEWEKYLNIVRDMMPALNEFKQHLLNCPECQKMILDFRDKMGLTLLSTPDEEFLKLFDRMGGKGE